MRRNDPSTRHTTISYLTAALLLAACQSAESGGAGSQPGNGGAGGTESGGATSGTGGSGLGGATNAGGGTQNGGAANAAGGATSGGGTQNGSGGGANGGTRNGGGGGGGVQGSGGAGDAGAACPGAKPDATNTGVPAGVTLTTVNGDVTVTQDGTNLDAQDIHGFLIIKASHVKVTRCLVRGGVASQNGDGINVQSGTDVLIEDTEVAIEHPSSYLDGVSGSNFTVRRANIHGGVDGMKLGSNSVVECSYIHDLSSFASDPNQGGGPTHNDDIQILAGTNIHVVGNQLVAAKDQNAAIQVTQDFGVVTDLYIASNWADGGGCTFNIAHKVEASLTGVHVTDNRFGRNSFYGCPILKSTQTTLVATGNVYDDDGTPVPIQSHD